MQTSKRFRMAFLLDEFKEKYLILRSLKENMNVIREKTPDFESNFIPNVVICYIVLPGGYLLSHFNDRIGKTPYVAVWSFGSSIQYFIKPPQLQNSNLLKPTEYEFTLGSRDFVFFNGVSVKHGYKQCRNDTFEEFFRFPDFGNKSYRMGITLHHFWDVSELSTYFYHGKSQQSPLHEASKI